MKTTICAYLFTSFAVLSSAQTPAAVPATSAPNHAKTAKTTKARKPPSPLVIPASAVKTPEGAYRYTDRQGKVWIYRETPFGISRVLEQPATAAGSNSVQTPFGKTTIASTPAAPAKPAGDATEHVTAMAKGDMIEFQKPTPFGMTSWQKKKSDLTADEQKIWAREQAKGTR